MTESTPEQQAQTEIEALRAELRRQSQELERAREALTETKRDLNKFRQHTDQCSRVSCSPDCQGAGLVLVMKNIESALASLRSGQGTSAEVKPPAPSKPRPIGPDYYDAPTSPERAAGEP